LKLPREEIVVSTKMFRSSEDVKTKVNSTFLSKKHIIEGLRASLVRLQLEYVDVVFAHRPDFETPLEETCKAFNWVID